MARIASNVIAKDPCHFRVDHQPYELRFRDRTKSKPHIPNHHPFHNLMVLKIRLARFGKRNAPFYNIVVAQARTARNSKPLEVLGTFTLSFLPQSHHRLNYADVMTDRHLRPNS